MPTLGRTTPVLRIFDEAKAREFYIGFLGFSVGFEHRFGDNFPLYLGLSHGTCFLHLSEHHGDASPGAHVRIECNDVDALCRSMMAKDYRYAKPGLAGERQPWGSIEVTVTDPFHNKLTFFQSV